MAASFRERAEAELRRGILQMAVLALLRSPTYGYDLIRVLDGHGLQTEEGTLYPILRRLAKDGLLASSWDTSGTRPRKYYESTDEGLRVLRELSRELARVNASLETILEESGALDGGDADP